MSIRYYRELAYKELGENNDETILFLHSKLLANWIWKRQKEEHDKYFNNYHCIFLDLPHHGKSGFDGEFTIEESKEIISEFIEFLLSKKINKLINIVALGLGASIALEILNENAELINKLIISGLESSNEKENEEDSVINRLAKTKAEYLNEKPDRFIVKAYLRYFGIPKEFYDDMEESLDIRIKTERKIAFCAINYQIPQELKEQGKEASDEYDGVKADKKKILISYGSKEDLNCARSAIELNKVLKNSHLIEIDKGNHLWNIIDSELFNRTVKTFIEEDKIYESSRIIVLN